MHQLKIIVNKHHTNFVSVFRQYRLIVGLKGNFPEKIVHFLYRRHFLNGIRIKNPPTIIPFVAHGV